MLTGKKRFSRRNLLAGAAGVGLTAALAPQSRAQSPKRGGRFRLAVAAGATSDTVDPAVMDSSFTIPIAYTAFNHLTETDVDGNLIPELSDEWSAEKSPAEWTFWDCPVSRHARPTGTRSASPSQAP